MRERNSSNRINSNRRAGLRRNHTAPKASIPSQGAMLEALEGRELFTAIGVLPSAPSAPTQGLLLPAVRVLLLPAVDSANGDGLLLPAVDINGQLLLPAVNVATDRVSLVPAVNVESDPGLLLPAVDLATDHGVLVPAVDLGVSRGSLLPAV